VLYVTGQIYTSATHASADFFALSQVWHLKRWTA